MYRWQYQYGYLKIPISIVIFLNETPLAVFPVNGDEEQQINSAVSMIDKLKNGALNPGLLRRLMRNLEQKGSYYD